MKAVGFAIFMFGVAIHAPAQCWITNDLLAYYPFNGNANDASGNGNNGVAYNITSVADRFGNLNSAFAFNGSNAYVWIGTNVRPATITASAWFNISATTNLAGDGQDMLLRDRFHGWHLQVDMPSGAVDVSVSRGDGDEPNITTAGGYNDGKWHMATITYDGNTNSVYVDGVLGQQLAMTNYLGILYNPGGLAIGRDGDNSGSYFQGIIDDVRIYNRALSPNEVAQLYTFESTEIQLQKAVYLTSEVIVGKTYQIQISTDLINWTNSGSMFTAATSYWRSSNYWDVNDWNELFFRLKPSP